jgi:hypothetical protein
MNEREGFGVVLGKMEMKNDDWFYDDDKGLGIV